MPEVLDYTQNSQLDRSLNRQSSLIHDFNFVDNIEFDKEYEGVTPFKFLPASGSVRLFASSSSAGEMQFWDQTNNVKAHRIFIDPVTENLFFDPDSNNTRQISFSQSTSRLYAGFFVQVADEIDFTVESGSNAFGINITAGLITFAGGGNSRTTRLTASKLRLPVRTHAEAPANNIELYNTDLSAGNTQLAWSTEGTGTTGTGTPTADRTVSVFVNGVQLYLIASTSAS